jgi:LuxR family maltose regulon positive regulatory protein
MGDVTEVVITTKLFRPSLRQRTVERARLYDMLRLGCARPLTLLVAPAGWGKSTLVAEWLVRDEITAGWVSLDGADNDPKRFWRYLLLAADRAGSAAGAAALRSLETAGSDVLRDVLPTFINALVSTEAPLILVLDDYHLVTGVAVHASVAMLLEHSPAQLHLILITRADPPLPVSRLRVREQLAELRAEDLRFSADEALEFFGSRLGPQLSRRDALRVLARTEGWAAGLQLAALQLGGQADPAAAIERFTGANRHILNYLGDEVLASQTPEVREFLMVTSVLNRMCAPLCDALTGRADSTELIGDVCRANLFVIPLDDELRWFRYHHLFAGLLRYELARTSPQRPAELHRRAARWYAEHGDAAEAIRHAIASGDNALISALVAAHWQPAFNTGHLETVRGWLDALPEELVAADASLSAGRVMLALDTGRVEEVGAVLDTAEASSPSDRRLMLLRALHRYKTGDLGTAVARLRMFSPCGHDAFVATASRLVLGMASMWLGDADRAGELLAEAARRAEDDSNHLGWLCAEGYQALLAVNRGDLALAESIVSMTESAVGRTLSESHYLAMFPALARARLELRRARWADAWRAAAKAVELGRHGAGRVELAAALLTAATAGRASSEAADRQAADVDPGALLGEARGLLRRCADPGPLVATWLAEEQRADAARTRRQGQFEPLTDRELTILRMLPCPATLRELAASLFVAPNTLKTHLRSIYRKLGVESREEAVISAREAGLI